MAKAASNPFAKYTRANTELKERLIGLSIGEPGSRKTSFWLEGPGPIFVQSLDHGMEGVVARVLEEDPTKEIYVQEYDWSPNPDDDLNSMQERAVELRDQLTADFENAVQHAKTVVWDKENDVWELFRYAEFGSPNDSPRNYPALNQRYRRLINMAKASDINFGLVAGMKDEWVKQINKKTGAQGAVGSGNRIRAGFGELDGLVHMVLHHRGIGPDDWSIEVGKVRGPGAVEIAGQTLPNLSFPDFAQLVFPSSSPSDWK